MYINFGGTTRCCSWAGKLPMGDISTSGIEEVWFGDNANKLRTSIIDQSFEYCSKISCPFLSNNSLPNLSEEVFFEKIKQYENKKPTEFNLAYDFICNHICPSCRKDKFIADANYKNKMQTIEKELIPYLKHANLIMASGNGDIFSSKYMLRLLSKIHPDNQNCIIQLETNGSLVKRNWHKIKNLTDYNLRVVVTPNSYDRETYKILSGGKDNLHHTLEGLYFLKELRENNIIKEFKITMVVQPENFKEVPKFIEQSLEEFNPDKIQLRPLMKWFKLTHDEFKNRNLLATDHPENKEFIEIMQNPICSHEKVFHWIGNNY